MSAETYNQKQMEDGNFTWEQITLLVQFWQGHHELAVDGYAGPNTQQSLNAVLAPTPYEPDAEWEPWDGPLEKQPKNRTEVYQMFGNPGAAKLDQRWFNANIVEIHGTDTLPGVPPKWYLKFHKDVEPYAREAFRRAQISSKYEVERLGTYNFRHIRFNPKFPLSYHSWGIAFDVNPDDNMPKRFDKGKKPEPWSDEWNKVWPKGVDEPFVRAMESCGFRWGGWWSYKFVDPMHFEFVGKRPV